MISYSTTEEQQMTVDTLNRFAAGEMRRIYRDCDETGDIPEEIIDRAWRFGLLPGAIPSAWGGFGDHSAVTGALIAEELAWGDLSIAMHILCPALAAFPVLEHGTEDQKKTYLPRFCGDTYHPATAALIEPRPLFDPFKPSTAARRDGDGYLLSGEKCYVPLAAGAELMLIYAADPDGTVQCFIVEKPSAAKGLTISGREKNMGIKALATYELTLKDVSVPATARLGGEAGCDFTRILNHSRVALAAMSVGVARAACDYAIAYAKDRHAFGEPIASRQSIAFMLAEMAIEVDATRFMSWEAAWKLDKTTDKPSTINNQPTMAASLVKRYADDMVITVADRAVQIMGGHGYIRDHPVELYLRNARGFPAFEGMAMI